MTGQAHRAWYQAFRAKDARFDGVFFVGVASTGIYCRPVCRARMPRAEHCAFFATAAAAEQAGFRPCLVCRPELAPGLAPVDAAISLTRRAARMMEEGCGGDGGPAGIAARLGCTGRHLRRVFSAEFGVPPVQYAQTCRLLLAKNLLASTGLPIIDVAMAAGFASLRRFNALVRTRYRLTPTALRRQAAAAPAHDAAPTVLLGYRPPYRWRRMLDFLAARAIPGVERVDDDAYLRAVRVAVEGHRHACGWVRVEHRPQRNAVAVTASPALLPVLGHVLARVRCLFDLHCNPRAVQEALASMNAIRPGLCVAGTRLPGSFDPFETAVRAVLGQQITVQAARTLSSRLVQAHGIPIRTGSAELTHAFPTPQAIAALDERRMVRLGITTARARAIRALARAIAHDRLDLGAGARPEEAVRQLMAMPGIGAWTAQYIAMRALGWPDAFLPTDHGVRTALRPRTPRAIRALAETWRPWRSYATINLWNALRTARP